MRSEPSMVRALELLVWIACTYFAIRYVLSLGD
jgi:hypothetical protein